ncbi:MAG: hypothetical protein IIA55_07040 [Gemmatimonadetes bacterium]|nr:hypothetical protein [Gemmatimonadota bacterium]
MLRLTRMLRGRFHMTALASGLSLVLLAAFGAGALAGELPKQGTYSTTWTFSGPYTAIEIGEDQWAWSSTFTLIIWNNAGEGFLHDMSGNCVGMGSEAGDAPFTDSGYCNYEDADGNTLIEYFTETEAGKGTATFIGGTGKYAGVQGSDTYEYVYTPDAPEGVFNGYGHAEGSYTLP